MDKSSLIVLVVVAVFVIRLFIPKKLDGFDLLGLPIMAVIRTYTGLPQQLDAVIAGELACLLVLGVAVGHVQAKKTKVTDDGRQVTTCGGMPYLFGWLVMLAGRLVILFAFHYALWMQTITDGGSLAAAALDIAKQSGEWLIWSTVAASSISYTWTLYRDHLQIKVFIHARLNRIRK